MTVSPNRPQDGDRPFAAAQAETDDRLLSPALPPTLFALPDLDARVKSTPQEDPISPVKPVLDSASTPQAMPRATETPTAASSPVAPAPVAHTRPEDIPAGRGWMERIGAHTLVLLMLVIVVAAALVTGKKQDDAPQSDSVAADLVEDGTSIDLAEIDAGTASAGLPIPPHVASAGLNPPTSESAAASASDSQIDGSSVAFDAGSGVAASPASTRNYSEVTKLPIDSAPLTAEPALASSASSDSLADSSLKDHTQTSPRFSQTPAGISDWMQYLPSMTVPTNEASTLSNSGLNVDTEATPRL